MKKKNISIKFIAILIICSAIPGLTNAQVLKNTYLNIDWQVNSPIGNDFANKISGWGANIEAGYYIIPAFSVGGFISYHTNNKYIDRSTIYVGETTAITSDQQHSIFQIPFGAALRYTFTRNSIFEPYIGAKLGANFSEVSSIINILKSYEKDWGFYAAPEIGANIFLSRKKQFGFHVAVYYNYTTNESEVLGYTVRGLSNIGFRLGVTL